MMVVVVVPTGGDDHCLDDRLSEEISTFAGVSERTRHLRTTGVVFTVRMNEQTLVAKVTSRKCFARLCGMLKWATFT